MFSKINRKISSFFRIPFTFKNWIFVIRNIVNIYLPISIPQEKIGVVYLRGGQRLKIRLTNLFDIGSIIEVYNRKVYFPSFVKRLKNPIIIDIGASIGDFSIICASFFENPLIYSYEPYPKAFKIFRDNISLNSLENKIRAYPMAVAGLREKNTTCNGQYTLISIEDIFDRNRIEKVDLLKMDCEGKEYEILFDTPKEYLNRINAMAIECHIYDRGENLRRLIEYLNESGYEVITTKITSHEVCYLYAKRY